MRNPGRVSLVILSAFLFAGCPFTHGYLSIKCDDFESIAITPLSAQTLSQSKFPAGDVVALHGSGSAKTNSGNKVIKVEQKAPIPANMNRATVFLNGWRLNYSGNDDQNVYALGTMIAKIRIVRDPATRDQVLTWNALGLLRDKDGKEAYDWSYNFTVLAWNDVNINAAVDHGVVDANDKLCTPDGKIADNFYYGDNDKYNPNERSTNTALTSFLSFIQNNIFVASKTVAIIPRGFAFLWSRMRPWDAPSDHHLLQIGYNLDHSEIYVGNKIKYNIYDELKHAPYASGVSVVGAGFVSWGSQAIFKDDDTRRNYVFSETVSAMGGGDVGVVQPPFSILPAFNGEFFCASLGSSVANEDVIIDNIPFEFAVPMLTGWSLQYATCGDQHVKEIGVWIDDWKFETPAQTGGGGRLSYRVSSNLRDKDSLPDFLSSHKVSVLGLRPLTGGGGVPIK